MPEGRLGNDSLPERGRWDEMGERSWQRVSGQQGRGEEGRAWERRPGPWERGLDGLEVFRRFSVLDWRLARVECGPVGRAWKLRR